MSTRKAHLGTVFLVLLMDIMGFSLIFPLFPAMLRYYLEQEGLTGLLEKWAALLKTLPIATNASSDFLLTVLFGGCMAALYSLLQFIFAPIWGGLSDRWGRRPIVLLSILGTVCGYGIWVFSKSFLMLLLSRVITGAMSANMAVATAATADLTNSDSRAKGMALVGIAFAMGFIFGPVIGGISSHYNILLEHPEWAAYGINPFSLSAACALLLALINFVWAWFSFGETLPVSKRHAAPFLTPWGRLKMLFANHNVGVRKASIVNFFFILAFSGMEFSLTFLAAERLDFTPRENGYLFVFVGLIMIAVQGGIIRPLGHRIGEKRLCLLGIILGIAGFFSLAQAATLAYFLMAAALMAASSGLMNILMAINSLYSTPHSQGKDMGTFRSAAALGRAVGPLFAASLYFYAGSQLAYTGAALALFIPLILAYRLPVVDCCKMDRF